jgi:hypothetical protein
MAVEPFTTNGKHPSERSPPTKSTTPKDSTKQSRPDSTKTPLGNSKSTDITNPLR